MHTCANAPAAMHRLPLPAPTAINRRSHLSHMRTGCAATSATCAQAVLLCSQHLGTAAVLHACYHIVWAVQPRRASAGNSQLRWHWTGAQSSRLDLVAVCARACDVQVLRALGFAADRSKWLDVAIILAMSVVCRLAFYALLKLREARSK
jgi:hypothetical protein